MLCCLDGSTCTVRSVPGLFSKEERDSTRNIEDKRAHHRSGNDINSSSDRIAVQAVVRAMVSLTEAWTEA